MTEPGFKLISRRQKVFEVTVPTEPPGRPVHAVIQCCLKKNQNAPRPSEHPPVKGEKIMSKRLPGRWDQRLQI